MSSNSGTGIQALDLGNILDNITRSITNNNTLNWLISSGTSDIPYAFMGIATIAAGTIPPRVTEIIPLNGAISCNLHAKALLFLCISSQETGNDFSYTFFSHFFN